MVETEILLNCFMLQWRVEASPYLLLGSEHLLFIEKFCGTVKRSSYTLCIRFTDSLSQRKKFKFLLF